MQELWTNKHRTRRASCKLLRAWSSGGPGWNVVLRNATNTPTCGLRKHQSDEEIRIWQFGNFSLENITGRVFEEWSTTDVWEHVVFLGAAREQEVHLTFEDVTGGAQTFTHNRAAGKDDVFAEFVKYLHDRDHFEKLRELLSERLQGSCRKLDF